MTEPTTEAGRRLLERHKDDVWLLRDILAIEAEARAGALDVKALAAAIRFAEQTQTDSLGIVGPADAGPPPSWYREYAGRILAALASPEDRS